MLRSAKLTLKVNDESGVERVDDHEINEGVVRGVETRPTELTHQELARYQRQILLPSFGLRGQTQLKSARVIVVGAGGLGCAVLTSLVSAGVGHITILDFDHISLSNLPRQPLYTEADLGMLKVEVARRALHALNPHVHLEAHATPILPRGQLSYDVESLISTADLIVDCTDRFDARVTIASYAHELKIPHCYGAVSGFEGQAALFHSEHACLCCLFPRLPPGGVIQSCDQGGVLGVAPQIIGSIQAALTLNYLSRDEFTLLDRPSLTQISLAPMSTYHLPIERNTECALCSLPNDDVWLEDPQRSHHPSRVHPISPVSVMQRFAQGWAPKIIDVRSPEEYRRGALPHAHLMSIDDLEGLLSLTPAGRVRSKDTDARDSHSSQRSAHLISTQMEHLLYTGDLLIYCERGPRSERASAWISECRERAPHALGHTYELTGGYQSWIESQRSYIPIS